MLPKLPGLVDHRRSRLLWEHKKPAELVTPGEIELTSLVHRLNYRLTDKCEADIDDLCSDACNFPTGQACGGRVLRCLTNKQDQVKSKVRHMQPYREQQVHGRYLSLYVPIIDFQTLGCQGAPRDLSKQDRNNPSSTLQYLSCANEYFRLSQAAVQECQDEIFYFEKMEVNDFRNDVLLAEACRTDVEKLCKNVQPGMWMTLSQKGPLLAVIDFAGMHLQNPLCRCMLIDPFPDSRKQTLLCQKNLLLTAQNT